MNGIPGIVRIKSTTARGASEVSLFFDWHVDAVRGTNGLMNLKPF